MAKAPSAYPHNRVQPGTQFTLASQGTPVYLILLVAGTLYRLLTAVFGKLIVWCNAGKTMRALGYDIALFTSKNAGTPLA